MAEKPHDPDVKKRKHGSKERELATQLTVAILHAAATHASPDELADQAATVYRRMLALVEAEPSGADGERHAS